MSGFVARMGEAMSASWSKAIDNAGTAAAVTGPQAPKFGKAVDPIERLPAEARKRLDKLREGLEDARAIARPAGDAVNEAIQDKAATEARLRQLRGGTLSGGVGLALPDDHPSVAEQLAKLA